MKLLAFLLDIVTCIVLFTLFLVVYATEKRGY